MSEPVVQSLLRLPVGLKTKIEQAAKENNRSINAETIVRLEKSFEESNAIESVYFEKLLSEFIAVTMQLNQNKQELIELKNTVQTLIKEQSN